MAKTAHQTTCHQGEPRVAAGYWRPRKTPWPQPWRSQRVAQRGLAILTPDLEPGVYDHERFLEIVKRLVLAKRFARVRVLISEPQRTIRLGNRLVGLGRRLNTYIEFRNVHEDYREHREAFLLADDVALLYRINHTRWEGIADTYEPAVARRYLGMFDEIWAASETSRELRQLRV